MAEQRGDKLGARIDNFMMNGGRFDSTSKQSKKVTFKGTGETSAVSVAAAGGGDFQSESLKRPIMSSGFKPGSAHASQYSSLRKGSGSRDGRKDSA